MPFSFDCVAPGKFVLGVGEVVVLPEVGKFFEVVGAAKTGFVQLQLLC